MNPKNTDIEKLDIALGFQPNNETLIAVKSYLDALENNCQLYDHKIFTGISLVEVKDKRKSNIFPNEMSNTSRYYRLFKMFGGYFKGDNNGNIATGGSYSLSFKNPISQTVFISQSQLSDDCTGLPLSFYRTLEEYCAQKQVNTYDYPFVIGMLIASVSWNDSKFVNSLDEDTQTWFVNRFKSDLNTFAKPLKKVKLIKKAA